MNYYPYLMGASVSKEWVHDENKHAFMIQVMDYQGITNQVWLPEELVRGMNGDRANDSRTNANKKPTRSDIPS
jgi:hypothetical protein